MKENKKIKIVFLILHYKIIKETKKCVDSILNNYSNYNINIIIVDNGSNNGSGQELKKDYIKYSNVDVIINNENLGFSRGNNVGFKYAKEKYNPDFIVMANNDIIFIQKEFCSNIIKKYQENNFAVLGPKIILPDGEEYIFNSKLKNVKQQRKLLLILYLRYILAFLHLQIFWLWLKKIRNKQKEKNDNNDNNDKKNVIVHGCCIIFSKLYIEQFDGLDDRTFLYCEEDLLYIRLMKNNLMSLFSRDLYVIHNHSVSTRSITKNLRNKEMFVAKNEIISNKILLEEIKNINKKEK